MKNLSKLFILLVIIFGLLLSNCEDKKDVPSTPEKHLYIAFGQSNMQGPGSIREKDTQGVSLRWRTLNVVQGVYAEEERAKGEWYRAMPPLIIPDVNLPHWDGQTFTTGLGPSDYFGRTLVKNIPEHITIGIVAVAHGALPLVAFHKTQAAGFFHPTTGAADSTHRNGWDRYINAGYQSFYDAIITNAILAQEQGWIVKGIIVHQGESGAGSGVTTAWHDMLKEIYNDILLDLELAPNSIPILLGQLWNGGTGPGGYLHTDNRIQEIIPKAWVISSAGCTKGRTGKGQPDNLHFGSEDLETFGTRYGAKMLELVYKKVITVE